MSANYIDNLGRAIDGIKLKKDSAVWLCSYDIAALQPELWVVNDRATSEMALRPARVKTPEKSGTTPGTYVATIEWVRWALANSETVINGVAIDMEKYDKGLEDIVTIKTQISSIDNSIKAIQETLLNSTLNAENVRKLNSLFEDTIILWGGSASGWDGEDD